MTETPNSFRAEYGKWLLAGPGVIAAIVLALILGHPHPHGLDLALLARQPWVIKLHLATALAAFALGMVQLARPKGDVWHRWLGWTWVVIMATVAGSSLFVRTLNPGRFSLIHLLSVFVLVMLPLAVRAARRGRVAAHRGMMTGLFVFSLIVAGAFTFLPGRLMWGLFFG